MIGRSLEDFEGNPPQEKGMEMSIDDEYEENVPFELNSTRTFAGLAPMTCQTPKMMNLSRS